MDKELRKLISELDLWLGGLLEESLNLQKDLTRSKGAFSKDKDLKTRLTVPLDSTLHSAHQLRQFIKDQKDSLKILQRSPPGMGSSMIDFLYNIVVNPGTPSQKSEHYNKLKDLDKNVQKEFVSLEGALKYPMYKIESKIKTVVERKSAEWSVDPTRSADLVLSTKMAVEDMLSSNRDISIAIKDIVAALQGSSKKELSVRFRDLINTIYKELYSVIPKEAQANLQSGLDRILQEFNELFSNSKESSLKLMRIAQEIQEPQEVSAEKENILQLISKYEQIFATYFQDVEQQKYTQKVDQILGQLKQDAKEKDVDLGNRYMNYIKFLFGPQSNNVRSYLVSIQKSLLALNKVLSSTSQLEKIPEEQVPPQDELDKATSNKAQVSSMRSRAAFLLNKLPN